MFETRPLLDKPPTGLELTYISGDSAYQPAVAAARKATSGAGFVVRSSIPLVLPEGQARAVSEDQLERLRNSDRLQLSVGPGPGDELEIADLIAFDQSDWRIERVEQNGLTRRFHLGEVERGAWDFRSISPPQVELPAAPPADPEFVFIDGPVPASEGRAGIYLAAASDPWRSGVPIQMGPSTASLSTVATIEEPSGIGKILTETSTGPLGRWDRANTIDVFLPHQDLSSMERASVLSGKSQILVQHEEHWELLAWETANLIGPDHWRLTGLLRGLSGSTIQSVHQDATVIIADARLTFLPMTAEQFNLPQWFKTAETEPISFTFQDRASLPWRVGHLRALSEIDSYLVTWTARGPDFSDNWEIPETVVAKTFRVQARSDGRLKYERETATDSISIPMGEADEVRVAEIGKYGRLGEWVSIPLPRS